MIVTLNRMLSARLVLGALVLSACQDSPSSPARPDPPGSGGPPGRPVTVQQIVCRGDRQAASLQCAPPEAPAGGASADIVVGGQHLYVNVTSSAVNYNSGTGQFTFNVNLQNLIEQPMGTTDGSLDPNGIRVFFESGPTVTGGTGVVSVLPDGFATFTAAGQPYYQYNNILDQTEATPDKTWTLIMPPTVTTFQFELYVSAPVQFPDGYVSLNGNLPGTYVGDLHPGSTLALTAVAKTAVGNLIPGATFTFGTDDPNCATISPVGVITGVRYANCDLDAVSNVPGVSGYINLDVTGTVRTWDGSASTDWANGANWVGDLVPAEVDSVVIPTGVPNFPSLTATVDIGGVEVADNATLSLGGFNLNVSANLETGTTAGSGVLSTGGTLVLAGSGGTAQGRVPNTTVTGSYALSEYLFVVAPGQIDMPGTLDVDMYELAIDAQ